MKSPRKTKNSNTLATISKTTKEDKDKEIQKKEQLDAKNKEKEAQFQKLEEYVNESGLALAFNIIFAELISKQILPENFFTYTSMRLKQIGKEIEGLKTKETIFVEEEKEEQKVDEATNVNQNEQEQPPQEEKKEEEIFMTSPQQPQAQVSQATKNMKKK